MLYLAWDREINISLFFATFLYENEALGLEQAAVVTMATRVLQPFKGYFCASPWAPNCMQNLKGGWKFSFPKMFDSYRDLFLNVYPLKHVEVYQAKTCKLCYNKKKNDKVFLRQPRACRTL